MASRGTAISRTLDFFRTSDPDTCRVVFALAKEIVDARMADGRQPKLPFGGLAHQVRRQRGKRRSQGNPPASIAGEGATTSSTMTEQS